MKKLIILAVAGALAAGWYWGVPIYQERSATYVIPSDWENYSNPDIGFMIRHDPDLQLAARGKTDVSFYKWGPTQVEGTEVYDGMSISFRKTALDSSFEAYANEQIGLFEQVGEITEPLHDLKVNGIPAKSFKASSLGDFTIIFVPIDDKNIIEIGYLVPDPGNLGFQNTIDKILSTFTLVTP